MDGIPQEERCRAREDEKEQNQNNGILLVEEVATQLLTLQSDSASGDGVVDLFENIWAMDAEDTP